MRRFAALLLILWLAPLLTSGEEAQKALQSAGPGRSSSGAPRPADTRAALEGFDIFVADTIKEWKVPGLAIAVVQDGTYPGAF